MKQTEILTHATHVNGWFPAVYMSCMSQNFRLFHVSNLSVRNFRFFLLMYPSLFLTRMRRLLVDGAGGARLPCAARRAACRAETPPLIQDPEGSGKHKFEHLNAKNKVAQVGKVVSTHGWRRPACVLCSVVSCFCVPQSLSVRYTKYNTTRRW